MQNVNQKDQLNLIASFQTEELEARLEFKKWRAVSKPDIGYPDFPVPTLNG